MSSLPQSDVDAQGPALESVRADTPSGGPPSAPASRGALYLFGLIAILALGSSVLLWQKLSNIQEQLARQSADAGSNAVEARAAAKQAQELARDTAARLTLAETRLGEVALQRSQLEDLIQSLSRSRDENLVADIQAALQVAQQQAQLTGSAEPLLSALRSADQRLERAGQPRLSRARAAVARDIDRIRGASVADVPGALVKLDELARVVDELPLANAVGPQPASTPTPPARRRAAPPPPALRWWERLLADVRDQARGLVRVSRIDDPDAMLLAPDQAFFVRENLKLKLLNARLGLLARQTDSARGDVAAAAQAVRKYFDASSRRTQAALALLQQVQGQLRSAELPRIDETLAVLATTAAGK
jgi:uroporphyrin-III C-methyltransferase